MIQRTNQSQTQRQKIAWQTSDGNLTGKFTLELAARVTVAAALSHPQMRGRQHLDRE
jgi:hypothetical protein